MYSVIIVSNVFDDYYHLSGHLFPDRLESDSFHCEMIMQMKSLTFSSFFITVHIFIVFYEDGETNWNVNAFIMDSAAQHQFRAIKKLKWLFSGIALYHKLIERKSRKNCCVELSGCLHQTHRLPNRYSIFLCAKSERSYEKLTGRRRVCSEHSHFQCLHFKLIWINYNFSNSSHSIITWIWSFVQAEDHKILKTQREHSRTFLRTRRKYSLFILLMRKCELWIYETTRTKCERKRKKNVVHVK